MSSPQQTPPPAKGRGDNKYGRRGALTPEVQQTIVQVVSAGNYLKVAAQQAGIGNSTLMSWLAKGRQGAAARDAHNPDGVYCPHCDLDRTEAVAELFEQQRIADAEYEREAAAPRAPDSPEPVRMHAVLDRCPQCGTQDHPQPFELDDDDRRYLEFLEAVTRAETQAEVAAVTYWRAAFATDWRAARDYLVRRVPDRWAATTRVQISSEEAETRIEQATTEALLAIGIDTDAAGLPDDTPAGLLAELGIDLDDDTQEQ